MSAQILHVKVTPKANADRIGAWREDAKGQRQLQIHVAAPPDKGRANEAVIRLLAAHYGVAPSRVRIEAGQGARVKRVIIS